jgi:hypothetical protein
MSAQTTTSQNPLVCVNSRAACALCSGDDSNGSPVNGVVQVLRSSRTAPHRRFRCRSVTLDGSSMRLTRREFELLRFFVENRNRVLSRDRLIERVWGYDLPVETRSVDGHVARLRSKLGSVTTSSKLSCRDSFRRRMGAYPDPTQCGADVHGKFRVGTRPRARRGDIRTPRRVLVRQRCEDLHRLDERRHRPGANLPVPNGRAPATVRTAAGCSPIFSLLELRLRSRARGAPARYKEQACCFRTQGGTTFVLLCVRV